MTGDSLRSVILTGFPSGFAATNCFIAAGAAGGDCVIVDPGQNALEPALSLAAEHELRPVAALVTHGHLDHMWSVTPLCQGAGIPAYIHPDDRHLLADPMAGVSAELKAQLTALSDGALDFHEPDDVRELTDGAVLELAGLRFTAHHAPGHTPGSIAFTLEVPDGAGVMLSGDLLFAGSIGRTDLPGGDSDQMAESLRRVCLSGPGTLDAPDEMIVLPGHGPQTSLGRERMTNPFLVGLDDGPTEWSVTGQ